MLSRLKHRMPQLSLLIVSVGVSLVGAEIATRYSAPRASEYNILFCYDPYLGWDFCQGSLAMLVTRDYAHAVRIGADGSRDFGSPDIRERNIVVVGDSFTSNLGIEDPSNVFTEV